MLSKEEIEKSKNRIKILLRDDCDCQECITNKEAYKTLLQYIQELEQEKQKVIDIMKADRMEQLDDYVIYLIEKYMKELGALEDE